MVGWTKLGLRRGFVATPMGRHLLQVARCRPQIQALHLRLQVARPRLQVVRVLVLRVVVVLRLLAVHVAQALHLAAHNILFRFVSGKYGSRYKPLIPRFS